MGGGAGENPAAHVADLALRVAGTAAARGEAGPAGCLATELALTRVVVNVRPDFAEGVRSVLVDKDGAPKWQPARIEDVDAAAIQGMFGG